MESDQRLEDCTRSFAGAPMELGVEPTLRYGLGACAAADAAAITGRVEHTGRVTLPGSTLQIQCLLRRETDEISMTGPAERVLAGQIAS